MSRLRRLVLPDRFFFLSCHILPARQELTEREFAVLARVLRERRKEHGLGMVQCARLHGNRAGAGGRGQPDPRGPRDAARRPTHERMRNATEPSRLEGRAGESLKCRDAALPCFAARFVY